MNPQHKVILIILDGWGIGKVKEADAIAKAKTPVFDHLWEEYPHATLTTFGGQVGLPEGQMGNSEVGHMNLGAGRVIYQDLVRINKAIVDKEFGNNPAILKLIYKNKSDGKPIHLLGLVSDGGVHSHIDHLIALVDFFYEMKCAPLYIHAFTDGRDTDPESGFGFIEKLSDSIKGKAEIASITGRYYAMDRDNRWNRIQLAYEGMVQGKGKHSDDLLKTIKERYASKEYDEFLKPIIHTKAGEPIAKINSGDSVLFFNFRTDRPRQLTAALTQEDFPIFGTKKLDLAFVTMTEYDKTFRGIDVIFHGDSLNNTLGEIVSKAGFQQVRIAESEKYPHITYFFNGGREIPFEGETREMLASPKVATYDLKPEMSAKEVCEKVCYHLEQNKAAFICVNFANADMVGHTGFFDVAVKAAEAVDQCLGKIVIQALSNEYQMVILADHGNADFMINEDGTPNTAHSMNPVPLIVLSELVDGLVDGKLADVAPLILDMLEIDVPAEIEPHHQIYTN